MQPKNATKPDPKKRWPDGLLEPGCFILCPNVLVCSTQKLGLKPCHIWLILRLQINNAPTHRPQFYWKQLADEAGYSSSAVRSWAAELQANGFVDYRQKRHRFDPSLGHYSRRNEFNLDPLHERLMETKHLWPKPTKGTPRYDRTDRRWPKDVVANGCCQVPDAFTCRLDILGLKPHHFWLVLRLQVKNIPEHPPRHYWAELAEDVGRTKSTIRRWAGELRDRGYFNYSQQAQCSKPDSGFELHPNEFDLDPIHDRLLEIKDHWPQPRKRKQRSAEALD